MQTLEHHDFVSKKILMITCVRAIRIFESSKIGVHVSIKIRKDKKKRLTYCYFDIITFMNNKTMQISFQRMNFDGLKIGDGNSKRLYLRFY